LGRQERRVPGGDVAQALGDRRDALLVQDVLDAVDGQRGIGGDFGRGAVRGGQRGLGIVVDVVDQADLLRAGGVDVLAGQGEFAKVPVVHDQRQAGQAADVGDDGELDLTHGELGVGAGVADVDGGDQVDPA